ncbi:YjiH family protein [Halobacillus yeomjeoni]|uniref:YjiH family protein n=1 Tax=Halobacillus yeomjeoni TaxID=311194 RepID=UPI001CD35F8D|nr:YjiH family protein [Halobacillus yeomjeoni]MCA0983389.1 YjiH family protein [Halobacillus yeomjeoni]
MEAEKRNVYDSRSTLEKGSPGSKTRAFLWFFIPSLLGVLLFLLPIPYGGKITIGVGVMAETVQAYLEPFLPAFMTIVLIISAIVPVWVKAFKPKNLAGNPFLSQLFSIHPFWIVTRIVGAVFAVMTLYSFGPAIITSDVTGGTMLYALVPVLAAWFLFAGLFMPLLMEFGLMDLIGTLLRNVMRPVFKLPGRSSIDALASWMGAGTVGVLITTKQYEEGYYTKREASIIATNFSINSIAFSLVVISFIGLEKYFVPFYLTVAISGLAAALICPRIPPLSKKADTYYEGTGKRISEDTPEGTSNFQWGMQKALKKASATGGVKQVLVQGVKTVMDIYFSLIPLVMALGTIALIIAEFTPFFSYLSMPIVPVLQWMQIPEAAEAAPAMLVGFADMFLPAVIGAGIESELTRFVIAAISLTQLIYMSEIGILLIKSKIPISVLELAIIFLQRTIITLPIIVVVAHFIF